MINTTKATRNEFINEVANWTRKTEMTEFAQTTTPRAVSSLLLILETQGKVNFYWEQEDNDKEKKFVIKTPDGKTLFERSTKYNDNGTMNVEILKKILEGTGDSI